MDDSPELNSQAALLRHLLFWSSLSLLTFEFFYLAWAGAVTVAHKGTSMCLIFSFPASVLASRQAPRANFCGVTLINLLELLTSLITCINACSAQGIKKTVHVKMHPQIRDNFILRQLFLGDLATTSKNVTKLPSESVVPEQALDINNVRGLHLHRFQFVMADNLALPLLEFPPTSVVTDEGFVDEENERIPDLNFPPPDLSPRLIRDRDGSISGGEFPMGSTARYLVPYTMMVTEGENIVEKISRFLLMASGFVTILSAVGAVSFADFYLAGFEVIRHEGCFQMLLLSGNFVCPEMRGVLSAECPLMVSLVDASGVVFGGAVAGYLIAACPVEILLLCFHGDHW